MKEGHVHMDVIDSYRDRDIFLHHSRTAAGALASLSFDAHIHDRYELYYFLGGDMTMAVENRPIRMEPGMFLLLRPGETHCIQLTEHTDIPYERIALIFRQEIFGMCDGLSGLLSPFGAPVGSGGGIYAFRDTDGYVRTSLSMIFSAPQELRRQTVICALAAIFSRCIIGHPPVKSPSGDTLVDGILAYINAHLGEEFGLMDVAATLRFDPSYLNRRFRAVMGTGIHDYTVRKRLLAARQNMYLQGTVSAGYETGGFGNYSTFYRQYKRFFGLSPAEDLAKYTKQG